MKEIFLERQLGGYCLKYLTVLFIFLFILALCSLGGPGILVASGVMLLYISAGLAVWSLVVYVSKIWRVLLR